MCHGKRRLSIGACPGRPSPRSGVPRSNPLRRLSGYVATARSSLRYLLGCAVAICDSVLTESRNFVAYVGLVPKQRARYLAPTEHHRKSYRRTISSSGGAADNRETGTALFRIVLQPEEAALLCAIRDGLCPGDDVAGSVLLSLMALRMLKCNEHGTDAESSSLGSASSF